MDEIFIRTLVLPSRVYAVTIEESGDYNIYVNTNLNEELQKSGLEHELLHIKLNHFFNSRRVTILENENVQKERWTFKTKTGF